MEEFWFFTLFGGLVATSLGFGFAWVSARSRAARFEAMLSQRSTQPSDTALDIRVSELAAQVEELARSQDFLHRMLTRKLERLPAAPERPREVTPH